MSTDLSRCAFGLPILAGVLEWDLASGWAVSAFEHRPGQAAAYQAAHRLATGAAGWVQVSDVGVVSSRGSDGRPARCVVARRRAGDAAADAVKVRQFGHALNNQLTAIQGYAELLAEQVSPTSELRPDLDAQCEAGSRAASLVETLMAFTPKPAGRVDPAAPPGVALHRP
jgi:signal transduction histidine kinase